MNEFSFQVRLLYRFYFCDLFSCQSEFSLTKRVAYQRFHLVEAQLRVILQQGDALTYALDAFLLKFLCAGGNGIKHVRHIRVVKHSAMDNTAPR